MEAVVKPVAPLPLCPVPAPAVGTRPSGVKKAAAEWAAAASTPARPMPPMLYMEAKPPGPYPELQSQVSVQDMLPVLLLAHAGAKQAVPSLALLTTLLCDCLEQESDS